MRRRVVRAAVLAAAVLLAVAAPTVPAWAQSATPAAPGTVASPRRPDAAHRLEIYQQHCASCHGPLGHGDGEVLAQMPNRQPGMPPSFADPTYLRGVKPADAFALITNGRVDHGMPPWKAALSDEERWDALFGAWSFYYTPERLVRGRAAWQEACVSCHGPDGHAVAAIALDDPATMATRSQADLFQATRHSAAHAALADLSEASLWSALDYARWLGTSSRPAPELTVGGQIGGHVANKTAGAGQMVSAMLRLVPLGDLAPGAPVTHTVGADGSFHFDDLIVGPGARYGLVANYGGVDFIAPDAVELSAAEPAKADVTVPVYDSATDVPVAVRTGHIIAAPDPEAGLLRVAEVWVVANNSDKALVAKPDGATLRIPLPKGIGEIRLEDARMRALDRMDGDTLVDTVPVPPGERQVVISYDLPYSGTTANLERTVPLDTAEMQVLATGPGVTVTSAALPNASTTDVQGQPVHEIAGKALAAGTALSLAFAGLPEATGTAANVTRPLAPRPLGEIPLAAIGLLLGALALGVALYYPRVASRTAGGASARLADERGRLVREIAALDQAFAHGTLRREDYLRRRAALMDRALAVARAQQVQVRP